MSLRNEWEFEYSAQAVAEASANRAVYHDERKNWWEAERERVVAELKDSGLEITEYEVTGGQRHNVQFDPKLTERLSECASKIKHHWREWERYSMFYRVLDGRDDRHLQLHPEDVDYFGLAA